MMNLASYRRLLELAAQPGVLERVLALLPVLCGLVGARDDQSIDWRVNRFLGIVSAMTPAEVEDRALLADHSRQRRIAAGAGINLLEVRRFLEEFDEVAQITQAMQGQSLFARLRFAQKQVDDVRQHVARRIHPPLRRPRALPSGYGPHEVCFGTILNHVEDGAWEVRLDDGQLVVARSHTGRRDDLALIEPGAAVYVVPERHNPYRGWIVDVERETIGVGTAD